jgi:hypothetical protein
MNPSGASCHRLSASWKRRGLFFESASDDVVVNKSAEFTRIYMPPDVTTVFRRWQTTALRRENYIRVVVKARLISEYSAGICSDRPSPNINKPPSRVSASTTQTV